MQSLGDPWCQVWKWFCSLLTVSFSIDAVGHDCVAALEDFGFKASVKTEFVKLTVGGMTCGYDDFSLHLRKLTECQVLY